MTQANEMPTELQQARARLLESEKTLKRKVRVVAADCYTVPAADLYTLAAGHKFEWTPQDWKAVLDRLDDCELTVEEYLRSDLE